jgi:hypothetical protein
VSLCFRGLSLFVMKLRVRVHDTVYAAPETFIHSDNSGSSYHFPLRRLSISFSKSNYRRSLMKVLDAALGGSRGLRQSSCHMTMSIIPIPFLSFTMAPRKLLQPFQTFPRLLPGCTTALAMCRVPKGRFALTDLDTGLFPAAIPATNYKSITLKWTRLLWRLCYR